MSQENEDLLFEELDELYLDDSLFKKGVDATGEWYWYHDTADEDYEEDEVDDDEVHYDVVDDDEADVDIVYYDEVDDDEDDDEIYDEDEDFRIILTRQQMRDALMGSYVAYTLDDIPVFKSIDSQS